MPSRPLDWALAASVLVVLGFAAGLGAVEHGGGNPPSLVVSIVAVSIVLGIVGLLILLVVSVVRAAGLVGPTINPAHPDPKRPTRIDALRTIEQLHDEIARSRVKHGIVWTSGVRIEVIWRTGVELFPARGSFQAGHWELTINEHSGEAPNVEVLDTIVVERLLAIQRERDEQAGGGGA